MQKLYNLFPINAGSPILIPNAFGSLLRAMAHPSLFDKTMTGLPFSDGLNVRSQDA